MKANATKFKTVDEYLSVFPPATRKILQEVRKAISDAAPDAEEVISYNMPAYRKDGILVYFAGYERHIGFYPTASGIEHFEKDLSSFKHARGSVQFPVNEPVPVELIRKIVGFRVKENLQKRAVSKGVNVNRKYPAKKHP